MKPMEYKRVLGTNVWVDSCLHEVKVERFWIQPQERILGGIISPKKVYPVEPLIENSG